MLGCHLHDAVQEDGAGHVVVVGEVGVEEDAVVGVAGEKIRYILGGVDCGLIPDVGGLVAGPHHHAVAGPVVSHLLEPRPNL